MVKQDEQTSSGTGQTQTTQGGGAIAGDTEVEIKSEDWIQGVLYSYYM